MPCFDYPDNVPVELESHGLNIKQLEAVLCGIFTRYEKIHGVYGVHDELANLDWKEIGVKFDQVLAWWSDHKKADADRIQKIRQQALEKLTPEERKILNIF